MVYGSNEGGGGLGVVAPHLFLIDLSIQNNPELKKLQGMRLNFLLQLPKLPKSRSGGRGVSPIQLQTKANKKRKNVTGDHHQPSPLYRST